MNDAEFEALEAEERRLWKEVEDLQAPLTIKTREWNAVYSCLNKARLRREILAEQAALNSERVEGRV